MPPQDPLDRLLQEATEFPGVNIRVGSLEATREIVENQLELARRIEIKQLRNRHQRLGASLHVDDKNSDLFDLEQQVMHLLPKVFRGGFVITLWSVLERCTQDIARRASEHTGTHIPPRLFRRPFFAAAESAMQQTVQLAAFPDSAVKVRLEQLKIVRDFLVHHDGRINEFPSPFDTYNSEQFAERGFNVVRDYDFCYVVPAETYLVENTALVADYIHSLADRVFHALHPE